jgi:hypothetical protein
VARTLIWIVVGGLMLLVVGFMTLSEDERSALRQNFASYSDAGLGYQDGRVVFAEQLPFRVTLEQLPTLEGRRQGQHYRSDMLFDRRSWFGISLRETVAACLDLREDQVDGDSSLDGIWLDIDCARTAGSADSVFDSWQPQRERILQVLLEGYGLGLETLTETRPVATLRAGPAWSEHLVDDGAGGVMTQQDGLIDFQGIAFRHLLAALQEWFPIHDLEGLDLDDRCTAVITWSAGDSAALRAALAEQLDLHIEEQLLPVTVAQVSGVARPPWEDTVEEDR